MNQVVNTASGGLRYKKKQKEYFRNTQTSSQTNNLDASFSLPYEGSWPFINTVHQKMMLEEISHVFQNKICHQFLLKKHKRLLSCHGSLSHDLHNKILKNMMLRKYNGISEEQADEYVQSLYLDKKIVSTSSYLLFGINVVTKYLEKCGKLALLIVCDSTQPSLMTRHLLNLCLVHEIYACAISNLSGCISPHLDMKSVLAIGFKEVHHSPFADLVEFIKDKIPTLEKSPWSKLWKNTDFLTKSNLTEQYKPFPKKESKKVADKRSLIRSGNECGDIKKCCPDVDLLNINLQWKVVQKRPRKSKSIMK